MKSINALSLADGIACGLIALERAGILTRNYFAAEINQKAIEIAKNYFAPMYVPIGDVYGISITESLDGNHQIKSAAGNHVVVGGIDLILCGSPCQGLSLQGKQKGFVDERSKVFFECVRIAKEAAKDGTKFLFENVVMKQQDRDIMSEMLGVEPVKINSLDFGVQSRNRLYWTNIPILPYEPQKFDPRSIIEGEGWPMTVRKKDKDGNPRPIYRTDYFGCATYSYFKGIRADGRPAIGTVEGGFYDEEYPKGNIRMLSPLEYERLQSLPDNYTAGHSKTSRYQMVGDAWHVDTIAHIFKGLET